MSTGLTLSRKLPDEIGVPPDVEQALRGDTPRRLSGFEFMGVALRAGVSSREVPPEYWHGAADLEGHAQAAIECPCGHRPVVTIGVHASKCECQRWFFYTGTAVLALAAPSVP